MGYSSDFHLNLNVDADQICVKVPPSAKWQFNLQSKYKKYYA